MQQASSPTPAQASAPGPGEDAPSALRVEVERSPEGVEPHVAAWDELVAKAAEPNPFFEPQALLAAWRLLPPEGGLEVVMVWSPNPLPGQPARLAGLFPLVRQPRFKGLPMTALATWQHLYSYLATPLVRADLAREAIAALYDGLAAREDVALIAWQGVGADGAFRHALIDTLRARGLEAFQDSCHTRACFRPAANAEAFLEGAVPGKKRKELRRQTKKLGELGEGEVHFDELAPDGDLDAWIDEFVALEQRGWKGQGGTALGDDAAGAAMFRELARGAHARGRWMTLALRLAGKPIAMKCNLRGGDGAVAFKIAYDEAYARFSPGVLLEVEHIRRMHLPGAPRWMDSGAAADHPMIGHLWRDRVAIETVVTSTGRPRGELAVAALPLMRWGARAARATLQRLRRART